MVWIYDQTFNAFDCPPQYRSHIGFGPVSGLMSGISQSAPSHVTTQWRDADCWLIYRCGGSAGFVADR